MNDDEVVFQILKCRQSDVTEAAATVVILIPVLMVKCASDEATITYETYERLRDSMGLFQVFLHVLEENERGREKERNGIYLFLYRCIA